jgi:hypothetical protein
MAKQQNSEKTAELKTVEEWAKAKGTKSYVFAAVSEAAGWAAGRKTTEREYVSAVDGWLKSAARGR